VQNRPYPDAVLRSTRQDEYYFPKEITKCDDSSSKGTTRIHHTWAERRTHFFHALATHLVQRCVAKGVGRLNIGDFESVQETDEGESKSWGQHNFDLHAWSFDRFTSILGYRAKTVGIDVEAVGEEHTSDVCCARS